MSALAEFAVDDHTVDVLPSSLFSQVESADRSVPLFADDIVRLLLAIPACPRPGLCDFLRTVACSELVGMPRGVVHTAMQRAQAPNQRDQDVDKLWALLKIVVSKQPCEGLAMSEFIINEIKLYNLFYLTVLLLIVPASLKFFLHAHWYVNRCSAAAKRLREFVK